MTSIKVETLNGDLIARVRACPVCGRFCQTRQEYRKHLRDHGKLRACELCDTKIPLANMRKLPFVTSRGEHRTKLVCNRCYNAGGKLISDYYGKQKPQN